VDIEILEKFIWFFVPFAMASVFLVLLKMLGAKIPVKQYFGVALTGAFLALLISPQCLCAEDREIILGALFFSLSLWVVIFGVISVFWLFQK